MFKNNKAKTNKKLFLLYMLHSKAIFGVGSEVSKLRYFLISLHLLSVLENCTAEFLWWTESGCIMEILHWQLQHFCQLHWGLWCTINQGYFETHRTMPRYWYIVFSAKYTKRTQGFQLLILMLYLCRLVALKAYHVTSGVTKSSRSGLWYIGTAWMSGWRESM